MRASKRRRNKGRPHKLKDFPYTVQTSATRMWRWIEEHRGQREFLATMVTLRFRTAYDAFIAKLEVEAMDDQLTNKTVSLIVNTAAYKRLPNTASFWYWPTPKPKKPRPKTKFPAVQSSPKPKAAFRGFR